MRRCTPHLGVGVDILSAIDRSVVLWQLMPLFWRRAHFYHSSHNARGWDIVLIQKLMLCCYFLDSLLSEILYSMV